jgi:NAD(P)-dependent dehydrogenase (short-subunit alcohol dehydrogenase family)
MSLKGKTALITGSSRGIGRGIALKLAEKGAKIGVHYFQNRAAAEATLASIRERGSDGFLIQADVCRVDDLKRAFEQAKAEFGKLDIFVSNARTEAPPRFIVHRWKSDSNSGTRRLIPKPRHFWSGSAKLQP